MNAEHTPGPWFITSRTDKRSPLRIRSNDNLPGAVDGPLIATIAEAQGIPIACANARLIAASPELLAACREMRKHIETITPNPAMRPMAFSETWADAIAKAEGRA